MSNNEEMMGNFYSLDKEKRSDFVRNFDKMLDLELASFFLNIVKDNSRDDDLRIEAVKVIGLYKGNYDDQFIKEELMKLIKSDEEDDSLIVYCINTLSLLNIGDREIKFVLNIIKGNGYILFKAAAFSLISNNKHLPSSVNALHELLNDMTYGKSAERELRALGTNK